MIKSFLALFLGLTVAAHAETPSGALNRLIKGNEHYVNDDLSNLRADSMRRESVASGQEPFATILTCSDSRVPPEIIFDQGVGDLFVVRNAGNVAGDITIDSIEYSVLHLHSSLILVMGHEDCGAVKAVLSGNTTDIESIAKLIEPAVNSVQPYETNLVQKAIIANVRESMNALQQSALLTKFVAEGKLQIVGGYYNLQSGKLTLIDESM